MAGIAGVMSGLAFNQITNTIGFLAGLKAFTAAVVGGIGSIPGAMIGGIFIGLCESFSAELRLEPVLRPDRVRDPDRDDADPAPGNLRPAAAAEGVSDPRPPIPARPNRHVAGQERDAPIGVDEWVAVRRAPRPGDGLAKWVAVGRRARRLVAAARAGHDRRCRSSGRSRPTSTSRRSRSTACCTRCWRSGSTSRSAGPGLLDLGYIAFFGFGAYGYAIFSSNALGTDGVGGTHLPAILSIPIVVVAAAGSGC